MAGLVWGFKSVEWELRLGHVSHPPHRGHCPLSEGSGWGSPLVLNPPSPPRPPGGRAAELRGHILPGGLRGGPGGLFLAMPPAVCAPRQRRGAWRLCSCLALGLGPQTQRWRQSQRQRQGWPRSLCGRGAGWSSGLGARPCSQAGAPPCAPRFLPALPPLREAAEPEGGPSSVTPKFIKLS